jgi:hypothetical protein
MRSSRGSTRSVNSKVSFIHGAWTTPFHTCTRSPGRPLPLAKAPLPRHCTCIPAGERRPATIDGIT